MKKAIFAAEFGSGAAAELMVVAMTGGKASGGDAAARKAAEEWAAKREWKGEAGSASWEAGALAGRALLVVGGGERFSAKGWRRAWAAAGRAIRAAKVERVRAEWRLEGADDARTAELAAEALGEGGYAYRETADARATVVDWGADAPREAVGRGLAAAETLNAVRDVANRPANGTGPEEFAQAVSELCAEYGVAVRVKGEAELEADGAGALLGVGRGSVRGPKLIRLEWNPAGAEGKARVIVGKAILFDAGGICLKPAKGMEWMQFDQCGGMTTVAAILLAAQRGAQRRIVGYVPVAENLPSGSAQRPGDVVRAKNGKTIEVLNTDAEGRLILADALSYAGEEDAAGIVDIATLTGAAVVALGHEASAVLGTDAALVERLRGLGEAEGERLWELPLWSEYEKPLKGTFADLRNMGEPGAAGTIAGAAFLKQFVPEGMPWAHLDVAGTAYLESAKGWGGAGATLECARLLARWAGGEE